MFFCEPCRERHNWPDSLTTSLGECELCNQHAVCWSVPSRHLPPPPKPPEPQPVVVEAIVQRLPGGALLVTTEAGAAVIEPEDLRPVGELGAHEDNP